MTNETVNVSVNADTTDFDESMRALQEATKDFGQIFSSTVSNAIRSGKGFEDTLKSIGQRLVDLALNQALQPLEDLFGNLFGGSQGGLLNGGSTVSGASGSGLSQSGSVSLFAKGGVVSDVSAFSFSGKLGIMGEAGSEAIMPLRRGSDGRLGVASNNGATATNIVFNVRANDVASFRKSEGQLSTMLARTVARGRRGL